jgi:DNA helicase HerA-like ATPase
MKPFRWPQSDEHTAILGCTGSGKTTLASWVLSLAPFDRMPFIAIDMKGDELLGSITHLRELDLYDSIPKEPGLYVVRPLPSDQDGIEEWLRKVWHSEFTGLYIDEAYLMPDKRWLRNILAQGRSKRIPVIAASQRPVDIPRSIFSESSHIAVFRLNDRRDQKTVAEFTPRGMLDVRLEDFHCCWYSPKWESSTDANPWYVLKPVPTAEKIIERINSRLKPVFKLI